MGLRFHHGSGFLRTASQLMWIKTIVTSMNDKIITALLAILIALGGWTLSRTFSLSQDMVLIKEKVSGIEDELQDIKTFKKKKNRKKNKRKEG
jgi:hypothetical protein